MYTKGHIHFMGIGGIGMSGIAKILRSQGYTISGCDSDLGQKSVRDLLALGCTIHEGNNSSQCNDASIDVLVYSTAINQNSEEIIQAQKRGIPIIPRALMLSEIMRTKFSIAVTGAHGKTTTTSLISHILMESAYDPTVIIGGHLKNISSNARLGKGDFIVAEADESDRSFLRLFPTLAVVTNIDLEHLETYKNIEDIKSSFVEFISHVPFYGKAIVCSDDVHLRSLMPFKQVKTIKYGFEEGADIIGKEIELAVNSATCSVYAYGAYLGRLTVSMAGKHNLLNALGALTTAMDIGVTFEQAATALENFTGVDRRFTFKGTFKGAEVIDDYGHHPTEIRNTVDVARNRSQGKLIVIFQPHRYTRTDALWNDFVDLFAFNKIDELIITDIFPASEAPRPGITAERLVAAIKEKDPSCKIRYIPASVKFDTIQETLAEIAQEQDLILIQGAGKITQLGDILIQSSK